MRYSPRSQLKFVVCEHSLSSPYADDERLECRTGFVDCRDRPVLPGSAERHRDDSDRTSAGSPSPARRRSPDRHRGTRPRWAVLSINSSIRCSTCNWLTMSSVIWMFSPGGRGSIPLRRLQLRIPVSRDDGPLSGFTAQSVMKSSSTPPCGSIEFAPSEDMSCQRPLWVNSQVLGRSPTPPGGGAQAMTLATSLPTISV